MSAAPPPPIISPDEVDAWLADSAVRVVTYHNTDRRSAAAILRDGVRIDRSWVAAYGQGFYTTTVPDPFFGEVAVAVALRLRRRVIDHMSEVEALIDQQALRLNPFDPRITPLMARRIRRELLDAGYDGLVIRDAGGDGVDYIISLADSAVRIVVDE